MGRTVILRFLVDKSLNRDAVDFISCALKRSFSLKSIEFTDKFVSLKLNDGKQGKKIEKALKNLMFAAKSIKYETIYIQDGKATFSANPMEYLQKSGEVRRLMTGAYVYQGDFLRIFNHFNNYWRDRAFQYNAIEQDVPPVWPVDLYKKINYFSEFPQQVILCSSLKNDFLKREEFADKCSKKQECRSIEYGEYFKAAEYGLQCAVCGYCYYILSGVRDISNTVFTAFNKVFRNEVSDINSLDRLTCFSMREIMFVGDESFVLKMRDSMIEEAKEFLKYLGIESKIMTANDPFFSNDSVLKSTFQSAMNSKYEILAKLPFADKYLAIGSINLHRNVFAKAFNIKIPGGATAWSGCLGVGFDRLVYSLFCQYGTTISKWPKKLDFMGSH